MVTTVHGRQPVHASRKKFHAMGDKALPVCEAIRDQLINDLDVPASSLIVSRNGIETNQYKWLPAPKNNKPVISVIGRLTGPKGDLCYRLLDECLDNKNYQIQIVSGSEVENRFNKFRNDVDFIGYTQDVVSVLAKSDLVIGAGRVAMESLLCGRPTLAIGEAKAIGVIHEDNIDEAMQTNFGDIGPKDLDIDFSLIAKEVDKGLKQVSCSSQVTEEVKHSYSLHTIVDQLEDTYQTVYVEKLRREVPVIMYHRFINNDEGKGIHGTYLHIDMLEKHFKLLKRRGFETLTFEELKDKGIIHRLESGKRYVIITVDDGYRDNFELLLPMLKKYQFKAVIYAVTNESYNRWDVENEETPEKSVDLMSHNQLKQMSESGFVEIGGHTLTHPHLDTLTKDQQAIEIFDNKKTLEQLIGKPLTSFAYPYGRLNQDSKDLAKEAGYHFSVATNSGPISMHSDKHQIRRIAIFPRTNIFGLWRKVKGNYTFRKSTSSQG